MSSNHMIRTLVDHWLPICIHTDTYISIWYGSSSCRWNRYYYGSFTSSV